MFRNIESAFSHDPTRVILRQRIHIQELIGQDEKMFLYEDRTNGCVKVIGSVLIKRKWCLSDTFF